MKTILLTKEAKLQDLYDRLYDIDFAIRSFEQLQALIDKHQNTAVIKRILSQAA